LDSDHSICSDALTTPIFIQTDDSLVTMTFRSRGILFATFGLGLVGSIVCVAAMIVLWSASARVRGATESVFANVDGSLVVIQQRAQRTQDRVEASAITTDGIASNLKEWTKREAGQRLVAQLDLAEKSDRLRFAMQQADDWLELSASSAESVQQALSMVSELGAQIDTGRIDPVIEGIASLRNQLAEATEFVDNLQQRTAAMSADEPREERIEQAIQLTVRVIATLSSIDSRIENFKTRLLETQKNLQALKIKTIKWIWVVTIAVASLIIWMGAGQGALLYLAWRSLRST
jgi:flagellin-like hook-associated protein FlgL